MDHNIAKIRHDYHLKGLREQDLNADPLKQFRLWFDEAIASGIFEANAMLLSTVADGRPSGRIVLLKDLDETGFSFFTNYLSKKGKQMAANPQAALTFFWKELERQVRVEGWIKKTTDFESDEYFSIRPRGSQIGAWVSAQSEIIPDRAYLEEKTREIDTKYEGMNVPRPPFWGGYRLIPDYIEFWQGRPSRLHDRLVYTRSERGLWEIERLSP
ncbi:pyridoxamine 5'-phosphate oxidase [Dyadobacter arcticus]|uniref:Pyridoxine/pyridoxamine 5'-phosphate oxidase n=1 Tax=Dyadobacter arcticus TaxID=1078754 RepID=A0ABX0UQG9_9BACT|nr:pyridoxamine 5'-phosphate oxidase [Dyadobacter arcticus]NIJ54189.1 pyridoxamine 5'-phosphate oxidase [Dyadobacter arcticus]